MSLQKPGWYWDPLEIEYNVALQARWRHELILAGRECYRLRHWDGVKWTGETLTDYSLRGRTSVPHLLGPASRITPLTPEQAATNLRVWALLMVITSLGCVAAWIVR